MVQRLATGESETHAILLYGAAGSGKEELAEILGQAWVCQNPGPDGADGTCKACGAWSRQTTPDLLRIVPTGASANIVVSQIVPGSSKETDVIPLLDFFRTLPLMSRNKVAIIVDAHRMNHRAANSLLKTLEEPHPHAKLILTTDSIGGVLPTILSRVLAVSCSLPKAADLAAAHPNATEDDLRLSEGAPRRIEQMLANPKPYHSLSRFAKRLPSRRIPEALAVADEFRKVVEELEPTVGGGARLAQSEALSLLAIELSRSRTADPRWAALCIEAHRRVVGNVNASLVFDELFAQVLALQ